MARGSLTSLGGHSRQLIEDVSVDPAHLIEVVNLQPLVCLVGFAIAVPAGANADCIGQGAGVSAATHHAGFFLFASLLFINAADGFDKRMVEREVERLAVAAHASESPFAALELC